jgi:ATP-binding cassette subfamily F protein uup
MLAKVLKRGGNVIVLDEPTNDLDLQSLRILEEAISNFEGSRHHRQSRSLFPDRVCDQIIAFEEAGVHVQTGNYSYYLEKRREREARDKAWTEAAAKNEKASAPATAKAKPRKLSFKETRELETIEAEILTAEEKVQALDTTLNDPSFYITRSQEASDLSEELDKAKAEVLRLYARWEELEAIKAAQTV